VPVLTATNIRHAYGEDIVLDGCSLSVEPGERIGIVGRNGEGKSTLLRIMGGALRADGGDVVLAKGSRRGYLSQDPDLDPDDTVHSAAERAFEELHRLHAQLEGVFDAMGGSDGEALEKLLRKQVELEAQIEAVGGYAVDHRIGSALHGLGFIDAQFTLKVGSLSGGQKARVALARLLLEQPDVLLLDEPTNHLDIEGRLWLESFLRDEYTGAVILISHDRVLLDRVVHRIVEVERGRLIDYPGNYQAFREQRADRVLTQQRAYEKQQTAFKREEAFIRKYKTGQRAKQARGRESRLDRAKETTSLERPMELESLSLSMRKADRPGELIVVSRGISKQYKADDGTDKILFDDLTVTIGRGERWGIIGPNGAGKTTLVRTMLGDISPDAGTVKPGSKLRIGHFTQTHEGLPLELNVYRYLQWAVKKQNTEEGIPDRVEFQLSEQHARNLAGAFLFSGSDQEKELLVLSGGERARLVLAGLLASAKNVLVLDEPTNHLDIPSAERLEVALAPPDKGGVFDGTLILISHDRALIDATCDHLLILDGRGGAEVFAGNYTMWTDRLARRAAESDAPQRRPVNKPKPSEPEVPPKPTQNGSAGSAKPAAPEKSRFSWMSLDKVESRMGAIESEKSEIDAVLDDPDVWREVERANALAAKRDALAAELQELENEWLRKSM
jgi:ATP-binding cassette subfamily F protein 3